MGGRWVWDCRHRRPIRSAEWNVKILTTTLSTNQRSITNWVGLQELLGWSCESVLGWHLCDKMNRTVEGAETKQGYASCFSFEWLYPQLDQDIGVTRMQRRFETNWRVLVTIQCNARGCARIIYFVKLTLLRLVLKHSFLAGKYSHFGLMDGRPSGKHDPSPFGGNARRRPPRLSALKSLWTLGFFHTACHSKGGLTQCAF